VLSVVPDLGVLEDIKMHYDYSRVPGWALRIAPRVYTKELLPDLPIVGRTWASLCARMLGRSGFSSWCLSIQASSA